MRIVIALFALWVFQSAASAQTQQAGADAGQADAAFQELIAKCDNTDILLLRGKTRLLLGRTTPDAAEKAEALINEGMAKCGEGDLAAAEAKITEGFELAQAGATEKFGTDASAEKSAETEPVAKPSGTESDQKDKPWWQFW